VRQLETVLRTQPEHVPGSCPAGFTNHLRLHHGSAARLLLLLLLAHPASWCAIGALFGGLVVAANQLILSSIVLLVVSLPAVAPATT